MGRQISSVRSAFDSFTLRAWYGLFGLLVLRMAGQNNSGLCFVLVLVQGNGRCQCQSDVFFHLLYLQNGWRGLRPQTLFCGFLAMIGTFCKGIQSTVADSANEMAHACSIAFQESARGSGAAPRHAQAWPRRRRRRRGGHHSDRRRSSRGGGISQSLTRQTLEEQVVAHERYVYIDLFGYLVSIFTVCIYIYNRCF